MGKVLDWADVHGVDLEAQRLSSTLPKVRLRERERDIKPAGVTQSHV